MTDSDASVALRDERECTRLVHRYAELADSHDVDAFVALFDPVGRWGRADGTEIVGHAAIRQGYAQRAGPAGSRHVVLAATPERTSENDIRLRSAALVFRPAAPNGNELVMHVVEYIDSMVREAGGRWCIARRVTRVVAKDLPGGVKP